MPHLHFHRTRYKAGRRSAAGRFDYLTGYSQKQLEYSQRPGREDLVCVVSRNFPAWAASPQAFFEAAELWERQGHSPDAKRQAKYAGVAFEEWKISLPVELTTEQNRELAEALMDVIAGDRLPCTYAFHNPRTLTDTSDQPHLHVLLSARITDEHRRTAEQHFKRWNKQDPQGGGARKAPEMNTYRATSAHRLMITDMINVHLEAYGHGGRLHPNALQDRGFTRAREPRLSPSESAAFRDKGAISPAMAEVLQIRAQRAQQGPGEQNNARLYWEQRKAFLGLTRDMPREAKVERIVALRHGTKLPTVQRSQPQPRQDEVSAGGLDKRWSHPIIGNKASKIYHLPTHKNYGDVGPHNQVRFWTEREAQGEGYRRARNEFGVGSDTAMEAQPRGDTLDQARQRQAPGPRMAQTLRQLTRRLEGLEEERGRPRRMRVQLHEDDRGMGY